MAAAHVAALHCETEVHDRCANNWGVTSHVELRWLRSAENSCAPLAYNWRVEPNDAETAPICTEEVLLCFGRRRLQSQRHCDQRNVECFEVAISWTDDKSTKSTKVQQISTFVLINGEQFKCARATLLWPIYRFTDFKPHLTAACGIHAAEILYFDRSHCITCSATNSRLLISLQNVICSWFEYSKHRLNATGCFNCHWTDISLHSSTHQTRIQYW